MCEDFEREIIKHCAPALCGVKSSNLISLCINAYDNIWDYIEELKHTIYPKYKLSIVKKTNKRVLLLIYDENMLYNTLFHGENYKYLLNNKYPNEKNISTYLDFLKKRINNNKTFPHEIGVFLGYDLDDVIAFNSGRTDSLYNGVWRVYSDLDKKLEIFDIFKKCSLNCMNLYNCGRCLKEIIN